MVNGSAPWMVAFRAVHALPRTVGAPRFGKRGCLREPRAAMASPSCPGLSPAALQAGPFRPRGFYPPSHKSWAWRAWWQAERLCARPLLVVTLQDWGWRD